MEVSPVPTVQSVLSDLDEIIRGHAMPEGCIGHLVMAQTHVRRAGSLADSHQRAFPEDRPESHRGCPADN